MPEQVYFFPDNFGGAPISYDISHNVLGTSGFFELPGSVISPTLNAIRFGTGIPSEVFDQLPEDVQALFVPGDPFSLPPEEPETLDVPPAETQVSNQGFLDFRDRVQGFETSLVDDINAGTAAATTRIDAFIDQLNQLKAPTFDELFDPVREFLPSSDLSAEKQAATAGAAAASGARESLARQNIASTAGALGGLENIVGQTSALGFEEAGRRGLDTSQRLGNIRGREAQIQEFISSLASGTSNLAGQLGTQLDIARSGIQGQLTGQAAGLQAQAPVNAAAVVQNLLGLEGQVEGALTDIETGNVVRDIDAFNQQLELVQNAASAPVDAVLAALGLQESFANSASNFNLGAGGLSSQLFQGLLFLLQQDPTLLQNPDFMSIFGG